MTPIQIVTLQYDDKAINPTRRIMIEKLGENVYRAYISIKEEGKVFSPFELSKETYDSASSALYSQANSFINKVINADNQTSDLLTSDEIKSTLKINNLTES